MGQSDTLILTHAVADADLGKNILRLGRILFYFAADVSHVYAEDLVVAVRVRPPDGTPFEGVKGSWEDILEMPVSCNDCQGL